MTPPRGSGHSTQPKSPVPIVASASSSVSPSPVAPPSRSFYEAHESLERESNVTVIPPLVPATTPPRASSLVTHRCLVWTTAKQIQHEGGRTATSKCALSPVTIVTRAHCRVSPLRVPPGALRPRNPVYPHAAGQRHPSSSLLLRNQSVRTLPPANVTETGTATHWASYPSALLPPPRPRRPLGAARAGPRNGRGRDCHQTAQHTPEPDRGQGKARAGDHSSSKELVHVLQVAFENIWPGAGCTGPSGKKRRRQERRWW
ncbi:hypothetical protein EDB86DRAFT_611664 [Lactarius hatsudake]|nr:hypothetical protein EDB86DRAFT_611664 [Lactarius hatsudake]